MFHSISIIISALSYWVDQNADKWEFLDSAITDIFQSRPGEDVTEAIDKLSDSQISSEDKEKTLACMKQLCMLFMF